eukprot:jgi/Chrzof1/11166/Cz05g26110.t1
MWYISRSWVTLQTTNRLTPSVHGCKLVKRYIKVSRKTKDHPPDQVVMEGIRAQGYLNLTPHTILPRKTLA